MQSAMKNATKVMVQTNKAMSPAKLQKQAIKFQREQQKTELTMVRRV